MPDEINDNVESLWITWESQRRSLELAQRFGSTLHVLDYRGPLRYPRSILNTLRLLWKGRPRVLFVQNPSMVLAALACVWGHFTRSFIVVDRHTTFLLNYKRRVGPRLFLLKWLHRFTLKRADLTLVTSEYLAELVRDHGGRAFVLPDPLPDLERRHPVDLGDGFNVLFPCSFAADEPVHEVMKAMEALAAEPVHLYVTGNNRRFVPEFPVPGNVTFTGFVPMEDYEALLQTVDAVMVLTTGTHVMVCGAYEAVAAGKVLITSSKQVLRDYFKPAVFVDNEAPGIAAGLREGMARRVDLEQKVRGFREKVSLDWAQTFSGLLRTIREESG